MKVKEKLGKKKKIPTRPLYVDQLKFPLTMGYKDLTEKGSKYPLYERNSMIPVSTFYSRSYRLFGFK